MDRVSCGVSYYQGTRSPNNAEREEKGYSSAWLHHKGRNKHHYEYWIDYGTHGAVLEGMKMPVNYVVEMFLDRIAASKVYRGTAYTDRDPLDYFLGGKGQYLMHEETEALLEKLLIMLAKQGEEKTFFVYPAGSFKKMVIKNQGVKHDALHSDFLAVKLLFLEAKTEP